ncbi:MAG TPA: PAS domain S-box protein [Synechococcales cyanobacterium M55_K2018_004]|nr:PAS domain S-box protein [Synechococcales cyanobacterium M55_K2018_004]
MHDMTSRPETIGVVGNAASINDSPSCPELFEQGAVFQQPESLFRQIFEASAEAMFLLENGLMIDCNPAAINLMRCQSREALLAAHPSQISPECQPDGRPSFEKANEMMAIAIAQRNHRFEWMHRRLDGEDFWAEVLLTRIEIDDRQILRAIVRDITETKRLEADRAAALAELQEQETLYRSIFETINDGIAIADLETGKIVSTNPAYCKIHGYSAEEMVALNPREYIHPESLPVFAQFVATVKAGKRFFAEVVDIHRDGRLINLEVIGIPFLYNEQPHALTVVRDISDRKAAEAALEQTNILVNTVLETLPGLLFAKDLQGRYLVSNSNLAQFFGRPIPEILGKTDAELLPPADAAAIEQKDRCIFEHQKTQTFEEVFGDRTYLTTKAPLHSAQGDLIGLVGLSFDISDRKAAEQAQARLTAILEATSDLVGIADMQGNSLYLNAAGRQLLQLPPEEDVSHLPVEAVHSKETNQFIMEQAIPTAIQQGTWRGENKIIARDGREIPVSQVIIAHKSADGTPEFLSTIIRDITEQKQAEAKLRQRTRKERLLNRITRQIRNTLDFDVILSTTVKEIRSLLNIDRCGFCWYYSDTNEWDTIKESKRPDLPPMLGRCSAAATGTLPQRIINLEIISIDNTELCPDQQYRDYLRSIGARSTLVIPLQGRSGVVGIIACDHGQVRHWSEDEVELLQAVTEQLAIALNQADLYTQSQAKARELEQTLEALQRTQLRMIQSEKMSSLGQLVAGVAHEINNPVNFIYGNISPAKEYTQDLLNLVDLYQMHYPNPVPAIQDAIEAIDLEFIKQDLPRLLASMRIGADRIRQIVGSLRTFSRLDEAAYKAVDIHDGIDSTLVILENRLKAKPDRPAVQIIKQYGNLPLVECYAGQLNQVFMNILTNALDALDERDQTRSPEEMQESPSRIQICTELVEPDAVAIRIIDNGPGMPESVKNRIFDPFFTTKPIGKGTGIGMSISYQIVTENHGGILECISAPGEGTEFIITIPRRQGEPVNVA